MEGALPVKIEDYAATPAIAWCPGCGNFGILRAMKKALVDLQLPPHQVLMVSGIGQAGKLPHYLRCHLLNELHGRPIPAATAAKLVNPGLTVIAVSGDGDAYGEGGNHLVHAMTRNVDLTYMVHHNQVYALTRGQAGPTSDPGYTTRMNAAGAWVSLRPLALAVAGDCSFVARGFAGDGDHLAGLIQAAVSYRGFALVEVLQPCPTFNRHNTFQWYLQRVYKLEEAGSYDPGDRTAAFNKALEWGERIPIGIIYRNPRPVFEDHLGLSAGAPLVRDGIDPSRLEPLLDELQ